MNEMKTKLYKRTLVYEVFRVILTEKVELNHYSTHGAGMKI